MADMNVMMGLCGYLSGLSDLALHVLYCYQLFGRAATLVIVGVQLLIVGWLVWVMIRAPDWERLSNSSTTINHIPIVW